MPNKYKINIGLTLEIILCTMIRFSFLIAVICFHFTAFTQISYPSVQKGIKFQPEDGTALIKFSFRSQNLFSYSNNFDGDDQDMRAMVRRMRLKFGGFLFDPKYEYKLELGFSNRDIGNGRDEVQVNNASKMILDAVFKYHITDKQQLWFGQTKLPGNRERVISSMALQFVDRSNVNSKFNIDRDVGVQYRLSSALGAMPISIAAAVTAGEGRNITVNNSGGLSYTGRAEFYPLGKFEKKGDYFNADLLREQQPKLAIGATYCFNEQTNRSQGQLGSFVTDSNEMVFNDLTTYFVDMMFKYKGWSVMSEYANREIAEQVAGYSYGSGISGQVGYLFDNNMEVAARYTSVDLATEGNAAQNTTEYTLCLSNYIIAHKLKWQTDFSLFSDDEFRFRFQVEFGI